MLVRCRGDREGVGRPPRDLPFGAFMPSPVSPRRDDLDADDRCADMFSHSYRDVIWFMWCAAAFLG
jgi:hypothetical protein